jgi:hypothetical protein
LLYAAFIVCAPVCAVVVCRVKTGSRKRRFLFSGMAAELRLTKDSGKTGGVRSPPSEKNRRMTLGDVILTGQFRFMCH